MHNLELVEPGSIKVGDVLEEDIYTSNGVLLMAAGHRITKDNETRLFSQDIFVRSSPASRALGWKRIS